MTPPTKKLIPGKFCIGLDDEGERQTTVAWDGFHEEHVYWNGWKRPWFTRKVAATMLHTWLGTGVLLGYTMTDKHVHIRVSGDDEALEYDEDDFDFEVIDGVELVQLGSGWTWELLGDL